MSLPAPVLGLPDFAAFLVLVGLGIHRLMRDLDTKSKNEG